VFKPVNGSDWIIGVVGPLQLDVLKARLQAEYNLGTRFEDVPTKRRRWLGRRTRRSSIAFATAMAARWPRTMTASRCSSPAMLDLRTTIADWPQVRFRESRRAELKNSPTPTGFCPLSSSPGLSRDHVDGPVKARPCTNLEAAFT